MFEAHSILPPLARADARDVLEARALLADKLQVLGYELQGAAVAGTGDEGPAEAGESRARLLREASGGLAVLGALHSAI